MHLSMLLDIAAVGFGERVAVGSRKDGLTFVELRDHARLVDVNSEAVPILLYGSGLAGLPFVPVNYRLGPSSSGPYSPVRLRQWAWSTSRSWPGSVRSMESSW